MNNHNLREPPNLRFLRCSPFRSQADSARYRMNNWYQSLLVITDGRMGWERDGESGSAAAGDVVYHPADRDYTEWTDPAAPVRGTKLNFQWTGAPWPVPATVHDRSGLIRAGAARILAIWGAPRQPQMQVRYTMHMMFLGVFAEVMELSLEQIPQMQQRVHSHVVANIGRGIPMAELAALFGYHPAYFVRKFSAEVGHSPSEEVRRIRLQAAREFVLGTDLPVKAIASHTGFADGPHLSRLFRQYYHCSIRELRTQVSRRADAR